MGAGEFVPGADGEAVVAAIDAVAHRRAMLLGDRPAMLDGEVADAAPRIEPAWCREGAGRADVEAGAAAAAPILARRIGRQVERRVDLAEEEPGAVLPAHQVGVLALPAQPGLLRQRLLHHRRGVHEDLHQRLRPAGDHPAGKGFEAGLHHVMIVAVLRIDADGAAVALLQHRQRVLRRRVAQAERDHAHRLRPERARMRPLLGACLHPAHRAVQALGEKAIQPGARLLRQGRGGEADGVEAEAPGLGADQVLRHAASIASGEPFRRREGWFEKPKQ